MRKHLFPALTEAYDAWRGAGGTEPLATIAEQGRRHWLALGRDMLARHARITAAKGSVGADPDADLAAALHGLAEARPL
jgi:hypothetical protein